jgi:hypothetical protein
VSKIALEYHTDVDQRAAHVPVPDESLSQPAGVMALYQTAKW